MSAPTDTSRAPRQQSAHHPSTARMVAVGGLYAVLIVSVIPWRSATIYSGGIDTVVIAKALLAVIALGATVMLAARTRERVSVGIAPAGIIAVALLVSALGSTLAGNDSSTIVLVGRMFVVMATILFLLTTVPWVTSIVCLLSAMAAVALVAAVTGVPTLAASGRLGGGIPEIHPNELAGLVGAPLVGLVILMLRDGVRAWRLVATVVLVGIAVATGSRIGLLAIAIGIVAAVLVNGIRDRSVLYLLLGALPLGYAIGSFTDVFGSLATRAGSNDTSTALDSRFDVWRVVLGWDWSEWQKWIGIGLSAKEIPVDIKWRDTQVLDSSWVSLLAQTGLIGTALIAALVVWCVASALISARRRWLLTPLLTLVIVRSITESGLVDSAMAFILFFTVASLLTHRSRHSDDPDGLRLDRVEEPRSRQTALT
ncbi:O-antigen ligase [Microbacterium foliorum]|uniref:O-antigen ligase family protein n=1 Tax=Microbacterium foliorum TaxID=104336 RepID=UPI00209FDBB1|nr:O-antigen ligase family protein [Microbacterium foliorum]MCP1428842.1 O-antigen ligase [Microbacterium foliorum]